MRCAPLFGVFCNHLSVCVCAHADWNNFIERLTSGAHHLTVEDISGWIHEIAEAIQNTGKHDYRSSGERNKKRFVEELRLWASYRAQTLSRTVRGMLHTHATIKNRGATEDTKCTPEDANKLACAKYRLVVTCQVYEAMKAGKRGQAGKEQALDIELLMERHPELYVASVLTEGTRSFSVLYRWDPDEREPRREFKIELPGDILVGEGKPSNQNHAVVFTRGRAMQCIDMNQDGYYEEALKMPILLEELRGAQGRGRILGYREHVFSSDISSPASFMATQEMAFVTASQRHLDKPLNTRFHYGHP